MRLPRVLGAAAIGPVVLASLVFATAHVQEHRVRPYLYANLYLPSGKLVGADLAGLSRAGRRPGVVPGGAVLRRLRQEPARPGLLQRIDRHRHRPRPALPFSLRVRRGGDVAGHGRLSARRARSSRRAWRQPGRRGSSRSKSASSTTSTRGDADSAARYFDLASRMPGGGDQARRFAAFVYSKGGHARDLHPHVGGAGRLVGTALHEGAGAPLHRADPARLAASARLSNDG